MDHPDISFFQTPENMLQASQMIFAAGVILRMALGEVTACNTLVGREVFKGKRAEALVPSFDKVFKYLADAHKAFSAHAEALVNQNKGTDEK